MCWAIEHGKSNKIFVHWSTIYYACPRICSIIMIISAERAAALQYLGSALRSIHWNVTEVLVVGDEWQVQLFIRFQSWSDYLKYSVMVMRAVDISRRGRHCGLYGLAVLSLYLLSASWISIYCLRPREKSSNLHILWRQPVVFRKKVETFKYTVLSRVKCGY